MHSMQTDNKAIENIAKFNCFETTATNRNRIHEAIRSRLMLENASYYSLYNPPSLRVLSKAQSHPLIWSHFKGTSELCLRTKVKLSP
jgi:hypothetical protein